MAQEIGPSSKSIAKRSCMACKKRHLKCELILQSDGTSRCVWCSEHGFECFQPGDDVHKHQVKPPNDGSIVVSGSTSAHGGFQLSEQSFFDSDGPLDSILRIRQDITEKNSIPWKDNEDADDRLRLDKNISQYLEQLFFDRVQPYIPVITHTYFQSIKPSQLLLAALYGVAARLNGALVSSRDFNHIKKCLHVQLVRLMNNYKPSLQTCIALTLIHITIELQTDGIDGVEAWPLRLSMAVRMALELKLHKRTAQTRYSYDLQEMRRRLFWAIFCKDRWTHTGKGYPLMIAFEDIELDFPQIDNLDSYSKPQHYFFVELVQQAVVLGKIHAVSFRADRYQHVTVEAFRRVEREVDELGHRLRRTPNRCDSDSRATLELHYAALRLLFYGPFFRPNSSAEAKLFSKFVPNLAAMRVTLAREAVYALEFASKELIYSGAAIWSISFYAQVRCFLVALSIKYDDVTDYPRDIRDGASKGYRKVVEIAKSMCEDKKWSFMVMSGTLVLFCARVAEQRAEEEKQRLLQQSEPEPIDYSYTIASSSTELPERYVSQIDTSSLYAKPNTSPESRDPAYQPMANNDILGYNQQIPFQLRNEQRPENQRITSLPPYILTPPFATAGMVESPMSLLPNQSQCYVFGEQSVGSDVGSNYDSSYDNWDLGVQYQSDMGTFDWGHLHEFHLSAGVPLP